jgi:antitoxin component of MazEF toxin-antitoxin module
MRSRKVVLGKSGGVGLRKIIRVGGSSPAVCIPEEFLVHHGLKIGDEVGLVWDGHLQIVPGMSRAEENRGNREG